MPDKEVLIELLKEISPESEISADKQLIEMLVPATTYFAVAEKLKTDNRLRFDYLISHTAVDFKTHFLVVNHLESTSSRHVMVLKTRPAEHENAAVDSLSALYAAAEYFEREVFDLFGIRYHNHPNLKRFFLEDGYGHPLRKDFKDEINLIER